MGIIYKQKGFADKYNRQIYLLNKYPGKFKLDFNGACAHVGPLRRGCGECFSNDVYCQYIEIADSFNTKNICPGKCPYCIADLGQKHYGKYASSNIIEDGIRYFHDTKNIPLSIGDPMNVIMSSEERGKPFEYITYNITGSGAEPSLYMPLLKELLNYYNNEFNPAIENVVKKPPTIKLYSNGFNLTKDNIDKLSDLGITELRINPAALNFSNDVFNKSEYAAKKIPLVSFEVAVYPPYKKKLYKLPSIANDIGVNHISWCQIKTSNLNLYKKIKKIKELDNYNGYQARNDIMVLDDNGLVEKLIENTIINNYNHSVIDCNSILLSSQKSENNIFGDINSDFEKIIEY